MGRRTTKVAPEPLGGVDPRLAAHRGRELAHDGEADAGADAAARDGARHVEPVEHLGQVRGDRCRARRRAPGRPGRRCRTGRARRRCSTVAYFSAFSTRFATICASRSGSVSAGSASGPSTRIVTPRSAAAGRNASTAVRTVSAASIGRGASENWRASIRARSSRSATSRSSRRASDVITRAACACSASVLIAPSVIASAYPGST